MDRGDHTARDDLAVCLLEAPRVEVQRTHGADLVSREVSALDGIIVCIDDLVWVRRAWLHQVSELPVANTQSACQYMCKQQRSGRRTAQENTHLTVMVAGWNDGFSANADVLPWYTVSSCPWLLPYDGVC